MGKPSVRGRSQVTGSVIEDGRDPRIAVALRPAVRGRPAPKAEQEPGGRTLDAVLDYRNPYFIGLRTDRALIRFCGRGHWGAPLGISVHDFAPDADGRAGEAAWQDWLNGVFGQS